MNVLDTESTGNMDADTVEPGHVGSQADDDMERFLASPGQAVFHGSRQSSERSNTGLRQHGDPSALTLGQWAVVDDNEAVYGGLPPLCQQMSTHGMPIHAGCGQLLPRENAVLFDNETSEGGIDRDGYPHGADCPDAEDTSGD